MRLWIYQRSLSLRKGLTRTTRSLNSPAQASERTRPASHLASHPRALRYTVLPEKCIPPRSDTDCTLGPCSWYTWQSTRPSRPGSPRNHHRGTIRARSQCRWGIGRGLAGKSS